MARISYRTGKGSVTLSGSLAGEMEAALREALGDEVVDAFVARLDAVAADTRRTWPVKTGRSRDSIDSEVRVVEGDYTLEGGVSVIDYARYIVSSREGTDLSLSKPRRPLIDLRGRMKTERKPMADDLKRAIVAALRRRGVTSG